MKTRRWVIWCASLLALGIVGSRAWSQRLVSVDSLAAQVALENHDATCYFFFVEDCPVSMRDFGVLRQLRAAYDPSQLGIVAIYVGAHADRLRAIADSIGLDIWYVADTEHALVEMTEAIVTPEYFVLDQASHIRYRGAIDNYTYGYAKHRPRATDPYLRVAIDAVLQGQPVRRPVTQPHGCVIEPLRSE